MPNVLVWGKIRELIAGDLPAGLPVVEVDSFEQARTQGDPRGSLLLTEPATIEAHQAELKAWLRAGAASSTLLVAVAEAAAGDEVLRRLPFVDDLLVKPVTGGRLRLRLDRAFDALHNRRVVRQLEEALARRQQELSEVNKVRVTLNKIGVALSAERDIEKLLDLILAKSREITAADAGSLYLVERGKDDTAQTDDNLRFKLPQNDSLVVPFEEFTMPLSETSIAGYVALTGRSVNVADAYDLPPGSPYRFSRSWDEQSGYRTKSLLAVPMRDHKDVVIGVVQLINKKRDRDAVLRPVAVVDEQVIPFTAVDEELVTSLASQAAVAYENNLLIKNIKDLFDSFVRASVTTIEKRDPTTSGHSERVADLTVGLAEKVHAITTGPLRDIRFNRDEIQQIRYASLLHDFGKVGVPERFLLKKDKLYGSHLELVVQRFECIQRTQEVEHLRAKILQIEAGASQEMLEQADLAFEARRKETAQLLEMIHEANKPSILKAEIRGAVVELDKRFYLGLAGNEQPFLTSKEVEALSVTKGSLTADEREHINQHVQHTYEFLKELPWTGELKQVPEIAWKHHATLDGSGYPKMEVDGQRVQRWKAEEIPVQARMMTICDIYDALTAKDRPYKGAVPVERALDILRKEEAGRGRIDANLLETFIEAKVYELTLAKVGAKAIGRALPQPPAGIAEHPLPKVAEADERRLKAGAKVS